MRHTVLILKTRLRIANNYVIGIREHMWVHLIVFLGVIFALIAGGSAIFTFIFRFLIQQEDFGQLLMDRLIGMVMMAFFSMLIFSNLIITLSTTYISREIDYYMSQPVPHETIFFVKLIESIVYSSWAFAILSVPLFLSFGIVRNTGLSYYLLVPLLLIPFLFIPAGIGALVTMLVCAFMPARRTLRWSAALLILALVAGGAVFRFGGSYESMFSLNHESFTQILQMLKTGSSAWMPHYWVTAGLLALSKAQWGEFTYWFLMILSAALLLLEICLRLAPLLYYRGWCLARDARSAAETETGASPRTWGMKLFDGIEKLLTFLRVPATLRALTVKDMKTFWRDPAQWSQLLILFGLLFLYVGHLRGAYYRTASFFIFVPKWQTLLSFFNLGATSFVLSILTTRFVYPMLSLEGKQFWVRGLAPMNRGKIIWQKYWLCWMACFVLSQSLIAFSNWVLEVPNVIRWLATITILMFSFGLTSLSVGLGASTPNFREDNPARIANGLGGTFNVILSMLYIGSIMALEIHPCYMYLTGHFFAPHYLPWLIAESCLLVLVQVGTTYLPMRYGLNRWKQMEF
ncbi:TPA: hypothetical protein DDW35_12640 [Candidatus Sumerlaeota bacterium]|nr:hypothetical protein [Candidatus Sumerlaeota bacterium]